MLKLEIPTDHSLAAWADWWLEEQCACRRRYHSCKLLAERFGSDRPVSEVARWLTCQECSSKPSATLVSAPTPVGFVPARPAPHVLRVKLPPA